MNNRLPRWYYFCVAAMWHVAACVILVAVVCGVIVGTISVGAVGFGIAGVVISVAFGQLSVYWGRKEGMERKDEL